MVNKDMMLLDEVAKVAKQVFDNYVTINVPGTYTAAQLDDGKNALGERLNIDYNGHEYDIHHVSIGEGSGYSFATWQVFHVMRCFERICGVRGDKKKRFTYGVADREIVSGKSMFLNKNGEPAKRKKSFIKVSERVAVEEVRNSDCLDMYYFAAGVWYWFHKASSEESAKRIIAQIESNKNLILDMLAKWDFTANIPIQPIYRALYAVLLAEAGDNTANEIERPSEAKNTVIEDKSEKCALTNQDSVEKCEAYESGAGREGINDGTNRPKTPDKTFPTELSDARLKIRRFKPRYFVRYINYHSRGESAVNQTGSGKSGGYSVVTIRGSTGIKTKTNQILA